jgi:hypothetical protein
VVVGRRLEGRVELEGLVDQLEPFVLEFLAVANFSGVSSTTVGVIGRGRRGRSRWITIGKEKEGMGFS